MAEDFNELLDQTETRAQALSVEADKAIELLDSVDEMLDNLSSTIEASANEAKESFDTITEQISTAEDTLQTHQEAAKESINALMQQVQDAGGRIQERLSQALTQFGDLRSKKQEFLGEIGEELGNVSDSVGDLAEECRETVEKLDRESTEFQGKGEQFSTSTKEFFQGLETEKQLLVQNLSDFKEAIKTELESAAKENSNLINYLYEDSNKFSKPIQKMFDKSVEPEEEEFLQAVERLNEVIENTQGEILKIGEFQVTSEENLSKKFQKSLEKTKPTLEQVNDIIPTLNQIKELLT